jgi:hypothetical protein
MILILSMLLIKRTMRKKLHHLIIINNL